jgi:hypothetical protein
MGKLPCPPRPSAPAEPVITEKTTSAGKEKLLSDYEDRMTSYKLQFHAYRAWLDEDARACSGLIATPSILKCLSRLTFYVNFDYLF